MTKQQLMQKIPLQLAVVFLIISTVIMAGGYLLFRVQRRQITLEKQQEMAAIAELKAQQIANWRRERMSDAQVLSKRSQLASRAARWLVEPGNGETGRQIKDDLEGLMSYDSYEAIILADMGGRARMVAGRRHSFALGQATHERLLQAIADKKITFSDFYLCALDKQVHLDIFIPLMNGGAPAAAVILRIDPNRFLYPLIQSWPVSRKSSETLIIRQEGDSVLFLNDLRFARDAAMKMRLSLGDTLVPSVMAALGKEGMVEGHDYRGINVLASVKRIPDSPWYMVAKIDRDEVYRPVRQATLMITLTCLLLAALAGMGIGLAWQWRQRELYQRLHGVELERKALVGHFDHIVKYANDIIFLADDKNRLIEANDRALQAYGRSRDELIGKTADILRSPSAKPLFMSQMEELRSKGSLFYETLHQRKDGTEFPVEISARLIMIEGKGYLQGIVRDITERKQAQSDIAARNKSLELLHQCAMELASLPHDRSLPEALTDWLKKMSGGYAVTFGEYDRNNEEIAIRRILLEPEALARIETAIGKRLMDVRSPVSPQIHRLMMAEQVGLRPTLHDITFGAIPKLVSATIGVMLGLDRFIGVVYQTAGVLYGTSVIALKKGQPEPDHASLKAFAALGAVSLRRAASEEKLQTAHEELQASYQEIEANNQELQAAEEELRKQNEELTASEEELKANEEILEQQLGEIEKGREELSASEVRYRRLFETAQDGILILNAETGVIEDANPFIKDLLGYPREDLIGKELWQIGLFRDIMASRSSFIELKGKGYVRYEDLPLQTKDGLKREVEFISNVYPVGDHNVVQCNIRDITERRRAEREIAKSRELLGEVEAAAHIGGWEFDPGTELQTWTEETFRILEVDFKQGEPKVPEGIEFISPAFMPMATQAIQQAIEHGRPYNQEWEVITAKGNKRWVHVVGKATQENGKTVSVAGSFQDITERKRAEENLRMLSLRQEAMLAAIPEIIMEVDNNKVYTWANPAGLRFFGEDAIGMEAAHYFEGEQDTYKTVEPLFGGSNEVIYVESWQRRKDGEKRLLAWHCRTLKNERGEVTGALSSAHDITERKETEDKIRSQLEELQRWHSTMLDREDRVRELKNEINALLVQLGQKQKYGGSRYGQGSLQ